MEQWKDVLDYEVLYQVSDLGRIKTLGRKIITYNGGVRFYPEKIMKPSKDSSGYFFISLCRNGKRKKSSVHRLVYETFNGKTKLQIDHIIEGNKTDNRLCNLQALTQRQNVSKHRLTIKKSSQYVGVSWSKSMKKWLAHIQINGKIKHIGYFLQENDAYLAYQNALSLIA